ncbi:MAG: M14 family metallopeptidase [Candidatus Aminicenantes bacterium]|nr:M14 family metallopeptidase [Candidatus Aminicenantes bacterium]
MTKTLHPILSLLAAAFLIAAAAPALSAQAAPGQKLLTVAEMTDYKQTSLHADVVAFIRELQRLSPLLRVETLCISTEGKDVPLVIVGNPLPASPLEPRLLRKPVVYIQANIHAGEVEGKEACLMLLRDILTAPKPLYLDKLVLLVAPIFNADGNDKIDPKSRPGQVGPEMGQGVRYNGQGLDLNRDAVKAESPEVQGLLARVLNPWDPVLLVDCHTTDGAWHEQTVTYAWPINPNGDNALVEYQRSKMLPAIEKIMKDKYATLGLGYGGYRDSRDPSKGWMTLDPQPRYITNYIGIRNRMGILDENYVHADFKTRVQGNYAFLRAILDYCAANTEEILRMTAEADARTSARGLAPTDKDQFAVEFDVRALVKPITVLGYVMEPVPAPAAPAAANPPATGAVTPPAAGTKPVGAPPAGGPPRQMMRRTDKKIAYTIPYFADFFPKRTLPLPAGYLLPLPSKEVVDKLLLHGLLVEKLVQPVQLEVLTFKLKEIKGAERIYQGHRTNTVKGEYIAETRSFPAGTCFVSMAQPLANVAAYLLEPESDDGLLVWNYFDREIVPQWSRELASYPVYKLMKPAVLVKQTVR